MDNKIITILIVLAVLCIAGVALNPILTWLWSILLGLMSFFIGLMLPFVLIVLLIVLILKK